MSWFQQGYEKVEQRAKELEEQQNRTFLPSLIISEDSEDVFLTFITSNPITYYSHYLPSKKRAYTCPNNGDTSKQGCPFCASGNKASFQGAYLVIDHRLEKWVNKEGKEVTQQHTPKIAKFGIRVLKSLQKIDQKLKKGSPVQAAIPGGILDVPFSVIRSGKGTDTQYTFNAVNPNPEYFKIPKIELGDKKDITELMVEAIKPLSQEKMLEVLGAPTTSYQQSGPTPPPIGQPLNLGDDDDEDVIDFSK